GPARPGRPLPPTDPPGPGPPAPAPRTWRSGWSHRAPAPAGSPSRPGYRRTARRAPRPDRSASPLCPPGRPDPLAARPLPAGPRPGAWEVRRWSRPRRCAACTGEGEDPMGGAIVGADGIARCPWATGSPALAEYHDTEWGLPVRSERGLFERLCLKAFQAGLSWSTVLGKRPALREAR